MSFSDVGKSFALPMERDELKQHITSRGLFSGCKGVTFHHTWEPDLAARPQGLTTQHVQNIADYYRKTLGWSAGPHFFVDDFRVSCMTPLNERGVHAKSFNATHIGIEVLGNYDQDYPTSGRGLKAWQNAKTLGRLLLEKRFDGGAWNFHRDDPKTDKSCPGKRVTKIFLTDLKCPDDDEETAPAAIVAKPIASARLLKLELGGATVWWDTQQKEVMVPAAEFLRAEGHEVSWDSDTWKSVQGAYYDAATETTYAPLNELVALTLR